MIVLSLNSYLEYFQKHPSSLDLCYLLRLNASDGITASYAAKELGLAIQTITNALKDLEAARIIQSNKVGRERVYVPSESATFSKAIDESFRLLQHKRIRGRHFPFQFLLAELGHELRTLAAADSEGLSVEQNVSISHELADIRCHFQIRRNSTPTNTIIISHSDTEESVLTLLGRVLLAARVRFKGSITIILLFSPTLTSYVTSRATLPETIRSVFEVFSVDSSAKPRDRKEALKKVNIIKDYADENTMLMPWFARKLAQEIWELRRAKKT